MRVKKIPRQLIVTGSAWISRIIIALVQILSIRILLGNLGSEQYAVFILLASLISWYMLADFGIGTGLQNSMSEERALGRNEAGYVALSALIGGVLLTILIVLLYFLSPYLSVILLKSFNFMSQDEKSNIFFISGLLFIGLAIGNIGYKAWFAQHKGYLSNIAPAIAAIIGFILIWLVMRQQWDRQSKLIWSVIVFNLPATILSLASFIWQITNLPKTSWKFTDEMLKLFIQRSLKFWLLYLMAAAVLNVDYLIISQYLSAHEVVVYGVASRIFGFVAFFYTSLYAALWPHFTEAITKNDWNSVSKNLKKAFVFSAAIVALLTILLILFMPIIVGILSPHEKLNVPVSFLLLLGAYHLILVWVHGFAVVLQSMSDMRMLLVLTFIQAALSIFFQIIFVQKWGIYGITLGLIASFLLTAVWVVPSRVRHHFKLSVDRVS